VSCTVQKELNNMQVNLHRTQYYVEYW